MAHDAIQQQLFLYKKNVIRNLNGKQAKHIKSVYRFNEHEHEECYYEVFRCFGCS